MSPNDENQMRIAIMESLRQQNNPRIENREEVLLEQAIQNSLSNVQIVNEDSLLQEAIAASIEAENERRLAQYYSSQVPAPRINNYTEERELRAENDRLYQESLRIDLEKERVAREIEERKQRQIAEERELKLLEEEARDRAWIAEEEATRALQTIKQIEDAKVALLRPPILKYPIEVSEVTSLSILKFRLPNGVVINHTFHQEEPITSVIQQLQYDLKYAGDLTLTIPPNEIITCSSDTSISFCGIKNRNSILVGYA